MSGARTSKNTHPVEPLLYDRRTTAKLLSISIRSVDYMVQTRKLAHRRIGSGSSSRHRKFAALLTMGVPTPHGRATSQ